jgi:hypothetical protein|nr:hypothetical protein [Sphingomonas sp. BT552]
MRVAVELLHLAIGLVTVVALTGLAAWAYPLGREEIWWCGGGATLALLIDSIRPLRRARRADVGRQGAAR